MGPYHGPKGSIYNGFPEARSAVQGTSLCQKPLHKKRYGFTYVGNKEMTWLLLSCCAF